MSSKITNLPLATPALSTDELPINRSGADGKLTAGSIATLASSVAQTPWLSNIDGGGFTLNNSVLTNAQVRSTGSTTSRTLDTRFSEIVNVKDFGALGDNSTDDTGALQSAINAAWAQTLASHGTVTNKILFFPPGNYKITSALLINGAFGVTMQGSGGQSTVINQVTAGATALAIKGCAYSSFRDFAVNATGVGGIAVDLDGGGGTYIGTQFVTFSNVNFGTPGGFTNCDYGFRHMQTDGSNGNNITFLNCTWGGCNVAAFKSNSFNALQLEWYNGDIQGCPNFGIWIQAGSASCISGVSFENGSSNVYDINLVNSGGVDGCVISGCRTESANFVSNGFHNVTMIGCSQPVLFDGYFYNQGIGVTILNCYSAAGRVYVNNSSFIANSRFDRSNFYQQTPGQGGAIPGIPYFFHNLTVNGTLHKDGYVYNGTISERKINSASDFLYTDNNGGDLEAGFHAASGIGWDAFCAQNDKNAFYGGGNNYGAAYSGEVLSQYYGYGNSSAGINHLVNYSQLNAAVDSPSPGSESGKWIFLGRQNGVDNVQWMQVGRGVIFGGGTTFPGNGNIALGGTAFASLPGSPVVGMVAYITDSTVATWGSVIAGGGTNKVLGWFNGASWTVTGA